MARIRYLKMGFFENEDLASLSAHHRLCFAGLWLLADKAGRLEDRPKRIAAKLFPYESGLDVNTFLHDLKVSGFITRYVVGDLRVIQVKEFSTHQRPRHDEAESELPVQPLDATGQPLAADNTAFTEIAFVPSLLGDTSPLGIGMGNGNRNGNRNGKEPSSALPAEPTSPTVLTFSTQGPVAEWALTAAHIANWQGLFPALDVLGECRKALAWCEANTAKRKTARGMPAFLVRWLTSAVDRGGSNGRMLAPAQTPGRTAMLADATREFLKS